MVVELVFEALPVEAEPPVVLSLTVALPLVAVCVLQLVTSMSLSLSTCTLLELVVRTTFTESGPVLLIEPELLEALAGALLLAADAVLSIVTEAFNELALEALPVEAPPPVVLCRVRASPVELLW